MVRRRAARYVLHRYHNTSSVTDMLLNTLQRTSLEECRKHQRLVVLYKMHHGMAKWQLTSLIISN